MQPDNNLRNGMQRQGVRAHRRHARSTETPAVNLQEHMRLLPGALTRRVAGGLSVNGGGTAAVGQQPRMQGKIAAAGTGHACGSGHAVGHQVAHAGGPSAAAAGPPPAHAVAVGGPPPQLEPGMASQHLYAVEPVAGLSPPQPDRAPSSTPQAAGDSGTDEFLEFMSFLQDEETDFADCLDLMDEELLSAAAGHQTAYGMAMGGPGLQPAQICSPADTCTAASADMVVSEADGGVPGAAHPDSSLRRHLAAQSEQHGKRPAGELYAGMQDVPLIPDVSAGAFHSAPPGVVAGLQQAFGAPCSSNTPAMMGGMRQPQAAQDSHGPLPSPPATLPGCRMDLPEAGPTRGVVFDGVPTRPEFYKVLKRQRRAEPHAVHPPVTWRAGGSSNRKPHWERNIFPMRTEDALRLSESARNPPLTEAGVGGGTVTAPAVSGTVQGGSPPMDGMPTPFDATRLDDGDSDGDTAPSPAVPDCECVPEQAEGGQEAEAVVQAEGAAQPDIQSSADLAVYLDDMAWVEDVDLGGFPVSVAALLDDPTDVPGPDELTHPLEEAGW